MQPLIPTWEIEARQRERKANKVAKNKRQEQEAKREVNQWWKQNEGEGFANEHEGVGGA